MLDLLVKNGPMTMRRKRDLFRRAPHFHSRARRPTFGRVLGRVEPKWKRIPNHLPLRVGGGWWSRVAGWCGSIAFHGGLVLLAAFILVQAAHVDVAPGKTSTELVLVAEPNRESLAPAQPAALQPVAAAQPAVPPQALPVLPLVPLPAASSLTLPEPVKPVEISKPTAVASTAKSKSHSAKSKTAKFISRKTRETSEAAQGAVTAQPDVARNEPPVYPEESRAAHEEGVVMLRVEVSAAGHATTVVISQSSGYFRLDQAARKAVRDWKFEPGSVAGKAIRSVVDVPVRFRLE